MKFIELLEDVNPSWTIKEKSRYLYQSICKNISYDERFAYGTDKELLYAIYNREINVENDEDTRLICRTANLTYYQLLERLGIKSKLIYKKSNVKRPIDIEDVSLIFWDENEDKYYTNIAGDIENCRFGLQTNYFGTKSLYEETQDVKEISPDELKQIDIKIGSIKHDYNNIVFKLLRDEVKNTSHFKKFLKSQGIDTDSLSRTEILENKLQVLNKLIKFRDKTAGPNEQKEFYKILFFSSVLDKFESKKFNTYEYVKEDGNKIEILSVIEINLPETPVYYFYSDEEQTYVQISSEDIIGKTKNYRERKGKKLMVQKDEKKKEDTIR